MRVLLVHDYGTMVGGAERSVLMLRDGLADRGHDVKFLAADRARSGEGPQQADVLCRGTNSDRLATGLRLVNPDAYRTVANTVQDFQPDIVHTRMMLTQLSPFVLPPLRDVPVIHHVSWYRAICPSGTKLLPTGKPCSVRAGVACLQQRCVTPQSWLLDMAQLRLYRRWRRHIDATVAISQTVARRLEESGIGPVTVIENAVAELPARPPLQGAPRLCYAGRLVPEKGVDVLLDAVAAMEEPDLQVDIVGAGPEASPLADQSRRLGLANQVTFHGHLMGPALQAVLDRAWIQVVPNRWEEPFGNAVTEAMARGTAVVASDIGGPAEIISHEVNGLLVAADDHHVLSQTLRELVSNRQRCERLGAAARKVARSRFSLSRLLDDCEHLYQQVQRAS